MLEAVFAVLGLIVFIMFCYGVVCLSHIKKTLWRLEVKMFPPAAAEPEAESSPIKMTLGNPYFPDRSCSEKARPSDISYCPLWNNKLRRRDSAVLSSSPYIIQESELNRFIESLQIKQRNMVDRYSSQFFFGAPFLKTVNPVEPQSSRKRTSWTVLSGKLSANAMLAYV